MEASNRNGESQSSKPEQSSEAIVVFMETEMRFRCGQFAEAFSEKITEEARQRIWAYYKCKGSSVDAIRLLGLSGGQKTFQKRIAEIAKAIGAESARDLFTRSQKDSSRVTSEYLMRLARLQDYKCALSGVPITPSTAELDHIVPFSKGGKNTKQNVQWVHRVINRMKGQMGQDEFKQWCRMVAR